MSVDVCLVARSVAVFSYAWSWEDDYGSNGARLVANERCVVWSLELGR